MIPQFSKDFYEICCVLFYPLCFCFIIFHFNLIRNGRFSIHDFPCQTAIDRAKNLENSADEVKEERSTKDPSPDSKSLESVSSQISKRIPIDGYEAIIGYDFLGSIASIAVSLSPSVSKYILITDDNLWRLYGEKIIHSFDTANKSLIKFVMPPGESSKTREMKANIEVQSFIPPPFLTVF